MDPVPMGRFCMQCGREITDNYGFCTACGYRYDTPAKTASDSGNVRTGQQPGPTPEQNEQMQRVYQQYAATLRMNIILTQRKTALIMLGIWIGLSLLISFSLLSGYIPVTDYLSAHLGMGKEPVFEGSVVLLSGFLAMMSFIACYNKKQWKIAIYGCLFSTLVTTALSYTGNWMCVYFLLFGLLATLRVRNTRELFARR